MFLGRPSHSFLPPLVVLEFSRELERLRLFTLLGAFLCEEGFRELHDCCLGLLSRRDGA